MFGMRQICRRPVRRFLFLGGSFSVLTFTFIVTFYVRDSLKAEERRRLNHENSYINNIKILDRHKTSNSPQDKTKSVPGKQACVHPELELWHPALKGYFKDVPPLQCADEEDWVYVDNGTFRISPNAIKNHGEIECKYIPLIRGNNDFTVLNGDPINGMKDGAPLPSDFFEVMCSAADKKVYKNLQCGIAYDTKLHARSNESPLPPNALGLDVLMFGFDSMSRMTWMRNLPKSHNYFVKVLGGTTLEGYNIVGDGTPQALLPILTGKSEPELPEARRGKHRARSVDGHPWIWKDFKSAGYVNQWGEDGTSAGTFTYRMLGFKEAPVDHYMRPFLMRVERDRKGQKPHCLGSVPIHSVMMHWVRDLFNMYIDKPKFSFLFHSAFTHDGYSQVRVVDDDLKQFLENLSESGILNNTLLILMADHGARFQAVRQTVQGKYEERMPYFSLRFPPWFQKKYPDAMRNFHDNAQKLTTPYDIHATFKHILNFTGTQKESVKHRGMSLLNEIPLERTCSDAAIEAHWCACLNWHSVAPDDKDVKASGLALLDHLNSITESQRELCTPLELSNITSAYIYIPNNNLLKFKRSKDSDGRIADLSDNMALLEVFFQITVLTQPNGGMYEATIKANLKSSQYIVNGKDISRINKYGSQPHCVSEKLPHMRAYCYCKHQLTQ